jgi:hypothetical protein
MSKHRRRSSTFLPLLLVATPILAPLACGKTDAPSDGPGLPSGIFGGAAGVMQASLAGAPPLGNAGAETTTPVEVCQNVPQGTRALLDDFDDGDSTAVPEPDREAYWFTIHDDSAGTIVPDTNFLPVPGGAHGSAGAAHITASGYSVWGAGLSANISHFAGGIRCPYNASKFSGLRFYARGSGLVRVELMVPEIVDQLYGGKCNPGAGEVCYDTHGISITPGASWQLYSFSWAQFTQRGFGKAAPFRPDAIVSLEYAFETTGLPVDVWFDDVSFQDGSAPPDLGAGGEGGASSGQPGAGGAAGQNTGDGHSSAGRGGT